MRYAETHRLAGSILVGVCHTDLGDGGEAASGYYRDPGSGPHPRNQPWIAIFNSTDDPHIPIAEARFVAAQLKCSYFEFTDRGHFVDSREFPEIVDVIRREKRLKGWKENPEGLGTRTGKGWGERPGRAGKKNPEGLGAKTLKG